MKRGFFEKARRKVFLQEGKKKQKTPQQFDPNYEKLGRINPWHSTEENYQFRSILFLIDFLGLCRLNLIGNLELGFRGPKIG